MNVRRTSLGSRILAMLLVTVMVLGMVPAAAFQAKAAPATAADLTATNVVRVQQYASNLLNTNFNTTTTKPSWDTEGKGDAWRYYNGVMLDALMMVGADSSKGNALEYLYKFAQDNIDSSGKITNWHGDEVDSVPPAYALFPLLTAAGVSEADKEDFKTALTFVYNELEGQTTFSSCGGNFLHKQNSDGSAQSSWDPWNIGMDGLYMAEPFLVRYANALADGTIVNSEASAAEIYGEVVARFKWAAENMYDEATGLYHHGWDVSGNKGNGHFWGRGIGWYAAGLVICIDELPASYADQLKPYLTKLFEGMLKYQDADSGMWYNVVNRGTDLDKNILETSVTSLMAYSLMKAYAEGWVSDAKYGEAGLAAFNGMIAEKMNSANTQVTDTYLKSGVGTSDDYYCTQSYKTNEAKGVGGVIMAASVAQECADKLNDTSTANKNDYVIGMAATTAEIMLVNGEVTNKSAISVTLVSKQGDIIHVKGDNPILSYAVPEAQAFAADTTVNVIANGNVIDTIQATAVNTSDDAVATGTLTIAADGATTPVGTKTTASQEVTVTTQGSGDGNQYIKVTTPTVGKNYVIAQNSNRSYSANYTGSAWAAGTISGGKDADAADGVYTLSGTICHWQFDSDGHVFTTVGSKNYYIKFTGKSSGNIEMVTTASDASVFTVSTSSGAVVLTDTVNSRSIKIESKQVVNGSSGQQNILFEQVPSGDPTTNTYNVTLTAGQTGVLADLDGADPNLSAILALKDSDVAVSGTIAWTSSDESVATVDGGRLTLKGAGETTITASVTEVTISGVKQTVALSVEIPVVVTAATKHDVTMTVNPGGVATTTAGSAQLIATPAISDKEITGYTVTYSGGSDSVATVAANGTITPVGVGNTTVTATLTSITVDGATYTAANGLSEIKVEIPVVVTEVTCEHDYTSEVTAPTCTAKGYTTYTCSKCNDTYKADYVNAKGHTLGEYTPVIAASCETAGSEKAACSACGTDVERTIPATGHKWVAGAITQEHACVAGTQAYTCENDASHTKTEPVAATAEHSYVDGTCSDCGAVDSSSENPTISSVTATVDGNTVSKATIASGTTLALTANIIGDADVKWSTSNFAIAEVSDSGVVTAKKAGTVTITATLVEKTRAIGESATFEVTVYEATDAISGDWVLYGTETKAGSGSTETNGNYTLVSATDLATYLGENPNAQFVVYFNAAGKIMAPSGTSLSSASVTLGGTAGDAASMTITGDVTTWKITAEANSMYSISTDISGTAYYLTLDGETPTLSTTKDANWVIENNSSEGTAFKNGTNYIRLKSGAYAVRTTSNSETRTWLYAAPTGSVPTETDWAQLTHKDYTVTSGTVSNGEVQAWIDADAKVMTSKQKTEHTDAVEGTYSLSWNKSLDTATVGTYIATVQIDELKNGEKTGNKVDLGTITVNVQSPVEVIVNSFTHDAGDTIDLVLGGSPSEKTVLLNTVTLNNQTMDATEAEGGQYRIELVNTNNSDAITLNGNKIIAAKAGTATVTVKLIRNGVDTGKTQEITVNVTEAEVVTLTGISVTPAELTFENGALISYDALVVTVHYSDGHTKTVPVSALTFNVNAADISNKEAKTTTVTATYVEGDVILTTTFDVVVKKAAAEGFYLDTTGNVDWNNGQYIIVMEYSGKYYALTNNNGSEKVTEVTSKISGNQLNMTEAEASNMIFTFSDANGYQIFNGTAYLRNDNNVLNTTNTNTIKEVSVINKATGEYGIQTDTGRYLYMSSTSDVKRSNTNDVRSVYLYKWNSSSASTEATLKDGTLSQTEITVKVGETPNYSGITMTAIYSDNSQKVIPNNSLTIGNSSVDIYTPGKYTVPVTYTEGGVTVTKNLTVIVEASSGTVTQGDWQHNFTTDDKNSEFYTITGTLSSSKGTVTYGGETMTQCLKMESSTNITFTAPHSGTYTLVFGGSTSAGGKKVKIDGKEYTADSNGIVTVQVAPGEHTVTKGDSINLFYMEYASDAVDGVVIQDAPVLYIAGGETPSLNPTYQMLEAVRHNGTDASFYTEQWEVLSGADVVTVNPETGLVTAQKPGIATLKLTVTVGDTTYSTTTNVTVRGPSVTATDTLELIHGAQDKDNGVIAHTVMAGGLVVTEGNFTVGFYSFDETIATVDKDGKVTAVTPGTVTIYTYIKTVNGLTIYEGDWNTENQPPYYDTTVVTVEERKISFASLNNYDFIIDAGSTQQQLEEILKYVENVTGPGVTASEGLQLTLRYNDGEQITANYGANDGLVVDCKDVKLNTVGIYPVPVTYTMDGKVIFQDTIWIHVTNEGVQDADGTVTIEEGVTYELDTDGLDMNEDYVIVSGSTALRNPVALTDSFEAASAAVTLATNADGKEVLTFNTPDQEGFSQWLLDTLQSGSTDDNEFTVNVSNLLRYLGAGDTEKTLIHTGVRSITIKEVDRTAGAYQIMLSGDGDDSYLALVNGVWTASADPQTLYFYKKHATRVEDYGFNFSLYEKNKLDLIGPEGISMPQGYAYDAILPKIDFNESDYWVQDYVIRWESSDESVATVDQNGKVTALKPGTATITATLYELKGGPVVCNTHETSYLVRQAKVTVTEATPTPVLNPATIEIGVGNMPNLTKVSVQMQFAGADEYNYDVPWSELEFKLADAKREGSGDVGFDMNTVGVYTVPVSYAGQTFNLTIHVVEDPYMGLDKADAIPGFPDAGSVRMSKTAQGVINFNQTGVTKLELTAAGVSTKNSVDVVLIVDVSNSMGWSMDWFNNVADVNAAKDNVKIPSNGAAGTDKLDMAMEAAKEFSNILLTVPGGDNTVSFVTFAGADRDNGGSSSNVDSVRMPLIGVDDYATAAAVFDATEFTSLTADGTSVTYKLNIGGNSADGYGEGAVSGTNRGNTNYDYAFGKASDAVDAVKAKWEAANPGKKYDESGRQVHVVFMTDGAPSHYNGKKGTGSAKDSLYGGADPYSTLSSVSKSKWLEYIKNYNTLATELYNKADGFYAIGFDLAHGGFGDWSWNETEMQRVLEGLVKNTMIPITLATDQAELNEFYTSLARTLAYAGTNARVTDKIGGNFSLFTGVHMYSEDIMKPNDKGQTIMPEDVYNQMKAMTFPINIYAYRLVTYGDIGTELDVIKPDGSSGVVTVDETHIGLRVNELPEILETVNFAEAGTRAYSTLKGDETNILTIDNTNMTMTIDAETFTYKATLKYVAHNDTQVLMADEEEIVWKIGNITDREVSMQYYVYLDGSLDNPREAASGVYETNEYAYSEYVDIYGKYVKREYGVPRMAWGAASVTVRFYYVNEQGQFVNRAGVTFTNPANRIFLQERAVFEGELNKQMTITGQQALEKAGVAGSYLYDPEVSAAISNSSGGTGSLNWTMTEGKANIKNLLMYTDYSQGQHINVVIDIPVVLTQLGEADNKLFDSTTVIDFSNTVVIDPFDQLEKEYMAGEKVDAGTGVTNNWTIRVVGFARYNPNADLKDYIAKTNWPTELATASGTYAIAENGNKIQFTPSAMLSGTDKVFAVIMFEGVPVDGATEENHNYYYMYKQVNIVPATVVHYETTNSTNSNMAAAFNQHQGNSVNAWVNDVQQGATSAGIQSADNNLYGYDDTYAGFNGLSDGAALAIDNSTYVNFKDLPTVTFTFTGTGIDIISQTGPNEGVIVMTLTGKNTGTKKTVNVLNKGESDMYQIPVLSVESLPYDTYTAVIKVYAKPNITGPAAYGGHFALDAIRVYGAAQESEVVSTNAAGVDTTVGDIYAQAGEAAMTLIEVREMLLHTSSFGGALLPEGTGGAVYVDGMAKTDSGYTGNFNDYEKVGPNNEVYLDSNQAVAFAIQVDDLNKLPASLDLGLKSVSGEPVARITVWNSDKSGTVLIENKTLKTATAMFYDLLGAEDVATFINGNGQIYIVVQNTAEPGNILSITDLKAGYGANGGSVSMYVNKELADTTQEMIESSADIFDITGDTTGTAMGLNSLMVTTGIHAEAVEIWNGDTKIGTVATYVETTTGARQWKLMYRLADLGENNLTIKTITAEGSVVAQDEQTHTIEITMN